MRRYFECQNCGRVHYGTTKEEAVKMNGHLFGGFNDRNLKRCASCGSSYPFFEVSEDYVNDYADGSNLDPWLYPPDIDDEPDTKEQTNQP